MSKVCLNCGTVFEGLYCPQCGQKYGPAMPTTSEIAGELLRSALSPSGKLLESLRTLLLKPGTLTRVYLAGQRLRYAHPVRVYLLCMFAFVAVISVNNSIRTWQGKPSFEVESSNFSLRPENTKPDAAKSDGEPSTARQAGQETGKAIAQALPTWLSSWLKARTQHLSELQAREIHEKTMRAMSKNYSALFAFLVPVMALLNWMLYAGRGLTYAAHFVFVLHATAAGCLILTIPYIINAPVLYFPLAVLSMIWSVIAAKHAFSVTWWGAIWRYVLYIFPAMIVSTVAGIAFALATVLFPN